MSGSSNPNHSKSTARYATIAELGKYFVSKVLPGLALFLSIPLLVRAFGADVYGEYARVWAFSLVSAALTTGWLRQSILRNAGLPLRGLGNLPIVSLVATVVASSAPLVLYGTVNATMSGYLWASSLGLLGAASAGYSVSSAVLQRDQRVNRFGFAEILRVIGTAYFPLVMSELSDARGVEILVLGAAIGNLLGLIVSIRWSELAGRERSSRILREFRLYGWPLSLWLAGSTAVLYTDRFIAAFFLNPTVAGEYAAVSDLIVRGIAIVSFPITMASHPKIMRLANSGDFAELSRTLRQWSSLLYGMLAATFLVLITIGPIFIAQALDLTIVSPTVIILLALSSCLWQSGLMAHKIHEILNKTRSMLVMIASSVCATVVVGTVLINDFGASGAAVGACTGPIVYLTLVLRSRRRLLKAASMDAVR